LSEADCRDKLLPVINDLWVQAGIGFEIIEVVEHNWDDIIDPNELNKIKSVIWSLERDPDTGMMTGKNIRKQTFVDSLMTPDGLHPESYDIWVFDFVGKESQGCCIDRDSRTIIVGRQSSKGYPWVTVRPLSCLGKTRT
jgi:hypothetical protein